MKRLLAASLLSFYLIPLATVGPQARQPGSAPAAIQSSARPMPHPSRNRLSAGHPSALAPILVPVNSQFIGADGLTHTLIGVLTLDGGVAPPPVEPVAVSGLAVSPSSVLWGMAATGTVTLNRAPLQPVVVTVKADSPGLAISPVTIDIGQVSATFPIATATAINQDRWYTLTASYNGTSKSANLLVRATGLPPPVPGATGGPVIGAFLNADGSPLLHPAYGQEARITGQAFGTTAGVVTWQGGPVSILSWGDTEIRVKLSMPQPPPASEFSVTRPDGAYMDLMLPLDLPARAPGSAKRR